MKQDAMWPQSVQKSKLFVPSAKPQANNNERGIIDQVHAACTGYK
jgi:hypothetical protein